MRRLLAVGALTAFVFSAFAMARRPTPVHAASNPGNLTLAGIADSLAGCPLGPAYTFCDQPVNTLSFPAQINMANSVAVTGLSVSLGPVPGLAANFAAGDFTVGSSSCAGSLAANAGCQINLEFSPTAAGLRAAALTTTDSEGDAVTVNVEGTGKNLAIAPPYTLTARPADNSFSFGSAVVNPPSPLAQTFTISAGAAISQITLSLAPVPGLETEFAGGGADFPFTNNCAALAAGGTCIATVKFTPTAVGLRSAALIATDSQGDTSTVYVSGYGSNGNGGSQSGGLVLTFGTPPPISCARANPFGFCNEPAGGVSPITSTFTLENASGTQVAGLSVPKGSVIAQGATAPDFTVQNSSCTSVLAAGATCNVSVAFTPTTSGLRQGAIAIADAQGDVATLNLAGVGDDYSIATQLPTEVSVVPGGTATFNATLTPDAVLGMNGEQVTFVCPANLPDNASCTVTPCPATITPGMPVSVKVTLVTSSATVVAPIPSSGCSSYGPSLSTLLGAPGGERPGPPAAGTNTGSGSLLYPALLICALFGMIGILASGFPRPESAVSHRRIPLMLSCAALAAVIFAGCHHHSATVTTATPIGVTILTVRGTALDSNGNSLNTSRSFQTTLDVVTK